MERRLAAILAADVVGYSRLMGADELGTLAAVDTLRRELFAPKADQYNGRTIKLMGDGALMEFPSVVDAVTFAVEVQLAMRARNEDVPADRRIDYRIGINIGDIIFQDDDIFGDGVNLAARLEGLADPGGICIRRNVRNQVRDKLDLNFDELGEIEVKNIARPVRAFRVVLDGKAAALATPVTRPAKAPLRRKRMAVAAAAVALAAGVVGAALWWQPWAPEFAKASVERMAFPLPDQPSIAVLPFDNMSKDPERERLVDGLTEDIITDLSRFPDIFVIARNSTFTYKGTPVKVQQVAEDLGVRYVLEGSIQTDGGRARVTAQLIDALTGRHVWAERYDRPLDDVFALQDEVTGEIVATIAGYEGKIADAEREVARRKQPDSLSAYELYLLGAEYKHRFTKEDTASAEDFLLKAIDIDPGFARAYVALAWCYVQEMEQGWGPSLAVSKEKFVEATMKAVELDNTDAEAQLQLAMLYSFDLDTAGAVRATRRAIELGPNNATALILAGWTMLYIADPSQAAEAVELIERAIRLNPDTPDWYAYGLGIAQYFAGQFEDSAATLSLARPPTFQSRLYLAASYAQLGREKEAAELAGALMQESPDFSARAYGAAIGIIDERALAHFIDGLRKAGIPE